MFKRKLANYWWYCSLDVQKSELQFLFSQCDIHFFKKIFQFHSLICSIVKQLCFKSWSMSLNFKLHVFPDIPHMFSQKQILKNSTLFPFLWNPPQHQLISAPPARSNRKLKTSVHLVSRLPRNIRELKNENQVNRMWQIVNFYVECSVDCRWMEGEVWQVGGWGECYSSLVEV